MHEFQYCHVIRTGRYPAWFTVVTVVVVSQRHYWCYYTPLLPLLLLLLLVRDECCVLFPSPLPFVAMIGCSRFSRRGRIIIHQTCQQQQQQLTLLPSTKWIMTTMLGAVSVVNQKMPPSATKQHYRRINAWRWQDAGMCNSCTSFYRLWYWPRMH